MTRYEMMKRKADLCMEAARRTEGMMRAIWYEKAVALAVENLDMMIEDAETLIIGGLV